MCLKLNSGLTNDAYITGLKPTLEANGDLHLTYYRSDTDLYYFIFDWSTGTNKKSTEILQKLQKTDYNHVVFIGSSRQLTIGNSLNRYEGYLGASLKTINTPSGAVSIDFFAPGIWSIHDNKNCIVASGTKNHDIDFVATSAKMTTRDQTWWTNTLTGKAEAI